jgi:hypothetical protein
MADEDPGRLFVETIRFDPTADVYTNLKLNGVDLDAINAAIYGMKAAAMLDEIAYLRHVDEAAKPAIDVLQKGGDPPVSNAAAAAGAPALSAEDAYSEKRARKLLAQVTATPPTKRPEWAVLSAMIGKHIAAIQNEALAKELNDDLAEAAATLAPKLAQADTQELVQLVTIHFNDAIKSTDTDEIDEAIDYIQDLAGNIVDPIPRAEVTSKIRQLQKAKKARIEAMSLAWIKLAEKTLTNTSGKSSPDQLSLAVTYVKDMLSKTNGINPLEAESVRHTLASMEIQIAAIREEEAYNAGQAAEADALAKASATMAAEAQAAAKKLFAERVWWEKAKAAGFYTAVAVVSATIAWNAKQVVGMVTDPAIDPETKASLKENVDEACSISRDVVSTDFLANFGPLGKIGESAFAWFGSSVRTRAQISAAETLCSTARTVQAFSPLAASLTNTVATPIVGMAGVGGILTAAVRSYRVFSVDSKDPNAPAKVMQMVLQDIEGASDAVVSAMTKAAKFTADAAYRHMNYMRMLEQGRAQAELLGEGAWMQAMGAAATAGVTAGTAAIQQGAESAVKPALAAAGMGFLGSYADTRAKQNAALAQARAKADAIWLGNDPTKLTVADPSSISGALKGVQDMLTANIGATARSVHKDAATTNFRILKSYQKPLMTWVAAIPTGDASAATRTKAQTLLETMSKSMDALEVKLKPSTTPVTEADLRTIESDLNSLTLTVNELARFLGKDLSPSAAPPPSPETPPATTTPPAPGSNAGTQAGGAAGSDSALLGDLLLGLGEDPTVVSQVQAGLHAAPAPPSTGARRRTYRKRKARTSTRSQAIPRSS